MYYNHKRLALSIFWVVLGIVLIVLSAVEVLDSSFYSGMSGGLIAVGIVQIINNIKYKTNPEYREKVDISVNDERNRYIRSQAWAWTGYILILSFCIGSIVAAIAGQTLLRSFFSYSVCFILVVYWAAYLIVKHRS